MDESRRQKIDLVWAAVYVSVVATVALALLFSFAGSSGIDTVIAIDLVVGWTLSVISVVTLLLLSGAGRALLLFGRILIGLACFTLIVAAGLGVLSIAGVG